MSDFFNEPAAQVEMDESAAHNLMVEALAELNTAGKRNEEVLGINRSVALKIEKARELRGRGNWLEWCAKRLKVSTRQVERIVQLGKSPDTLPVEEQMAILWGHRVRQDGDGDPKSPANKSPTSYSRNKAWGGCNRWTTQTEALARENDLLKDPAYLSFVELTEASKTKFRELERKAKK